MISNYFVYYSLFQFIRFDLPRAIRQRRFGTEEEDCEFDDSPEKREPKVEDINGYSHDIDASGAESLRFP